MVYGQVHNMLPWIHCDHVVGHCVPSASDGNMDLGAYPHEDDALNLFQTSKKIASKRRIYPTVLSCSTAEQRKRASYWLSLPEAACTPELAEHRTEGWEASVLLNLGQPAWQDARISTVNEVYTIDAMLCSSLGLIDLPDKKALLANWTAVEEMSVRDCSSKVVQAIISSTPPLELSSALNDIRASLKVQRKLPVQSRTEVINEDQRLKFLANECSDGNYACLIRFCSHNFCHLKGGSIAMGCQCDKEWDVLPIPQ